jgi:hypothetical protein
VAGLGNFCLVQTATVDLTQAGIKLPKKVKKQFKRQRGSVVDRKALQKPFPLDPVSGMTRQTLKLNAPGRRLLSKANQQKKDLPVSPEVDVVVNQEPTRLQLLARLLKRLR